MTSSFYWHDYETWGADPKVDRPAQFAGLRTDLEFNPIGAPLLLYAKPADDFLPHPEACFVTGLTPQLCRDEGVPEAEFFSTIHQELAQPGTCALGYNSIRFDDEVSRLGFYRNFFDPYAREWKNGNSRWDLIDVARLTRALRPEGIEWPDDADGVPSFRLEALTAANHIEHSGAHDALADVLATLELAKLIRAKQPKLFDYVFSHRTKAWYAEVLNPANRRPVVHVTSRYPARLGCLAVVLPLAWHPTHQNSVIVFDLRQDPQALIDLDAQQISKRLYTKVTDLPDDVERIALKSIRINHAPIVVPTSTLTPEAREKWQLDETTENRHRQKLLDGPDLMAKLHEVFAPMDSTEPMDADIALYQGFVADADRARCEKVRSLSPKDLADFAANFDDPRLASLYFRYRARNWPHTLSVHERADWEQFRRDRLQNPLPGGLSLAAYRQKLAKMAIDPNLPSEHRTILDALLDWPEAIGL